MGHFLFNQYSKLCKKRIFKTYYALCPGKGALQSVIPEKIGGI